MLPRIFTPYQHEPLAGLSGIDAAIDGGIENLGGSLAMSDLPQVTVISREGVTSVIAQSAGQDTLMQLLFENDQDIEAACGGCASCATCHVYISEAWVSRLPPREQVEDLLLAYSDHFDKGRSRLSCQITMTPEMNGLTLEIAPEE